MAKTVAGIKETKRTGEALVKYSKFRDSLMKITPLVDKLNARDKRAVATMKSLQGLLEDNSDYTDSKIKEEIMSRLGVASGRFDDYNIIGRDSSGTGKTKKEQKEMNPRGFRHGGKVHRGRVAGSSAEKSRT
jgi:hypothetical protein